MKKHFPMMLAAVAWGGILWGGNLWGGGIPAAGGESAAGMPPPPSAPGYPFVRYSPKMPFTGVATFSRGQDYWFFVEDESGQPWRIERDSRDFPISPGDLVRVEGGVSRWNYTTPHINSARLAPVGREESRLPKPLSLTTRDLYRHPVNDPAASDLYGRLVSVEATLIDINRRDNYTQFLFIDEGSHFQSTLYISIKTPLDESLQRGARFRVTGLAIYSPDDDPATCTFTTFRDVAVMPQDASAFVLLDEAPFWTPLRLGILFGALLAVAAGAFAWVATLRRTVARQTAVIAAKSRAAIESEALRKERLRLSYELHDNIQQFLLGAKFTLDAALAYAGNDANPKLCALIAKAEKTVGYAQSGLRAALWGISEESALERSLSGLFRAAIGRLPHAGDIVEFSVEGEEPPGARRFAGTLLLVLQEAIGNAIRHGRATRIAVTLGYSGDSLRLSVADNGCGFDPGGARLSRPPGFGLAGIRRRIDDFKGTFTIESTPGKGTTLTAEIPL